MGQKEDYALANRRRSAKGLMKNYSSEELKMMAEIGDYLYQRIELGASTGEVLTHLSDKTRYCDFLKNNRKLTFYHFETAYLLQHDQIDGVSMKQRRNYALEKMAEKSLDAMVAAEDQRHLDSQEEFPQTAYHARGW